MATLATFKTPEVDNEPLVRRHASEDIRECLFTTLLQRTYAPGTVHRLELEATIATMKKELPFEVPCVVNGKPVSLFPL